MNSKIKLPTKKITKNTIKEVISKTEKKIKSAETELKTISSSIKKIHKSIPSEDEIQLKNSLTEIFQKQKIFFATGITLDPKWRRAQLIKLRNAIKKFENEIFSALKADLFKPSYEAYLTELGTTYSELNKSIKNIYKWSKPIHSGPTLSSLFSYNKIYSEPYGVTLIMSPWNFPFLLSMEPLIGAIEAGNCAIIKPSRYSSFTTTVIEKIIQSIFPPEYITVVKGGHEQNSILLSLPFNFIFFTGSKSIGKIVLENAAKNLTPTCLELGGKSPCIVDKSTNLNYAAKIITWGKCLNAGQICISPDYILVDESVKGILLAELKKELLKQYGANPLYNEDFCKIINEKHFKRLCSLAPMAKNDPLSNKIAPTIVDLGEINSNLFNTSPLMKEEIFGPIIPIISYTDINTVIEYINSGDKPLALYCFSKNKKLYNTLISKVSYGGGCINDVIFHNAVTTLPFGGVGSSGMGRYHGKASFDVFSNKKSVLFRLPFPLINIRFAPYTFKSLKQIRHLFK